MVHQEGKGVPHYWQLVEQGGRRGQNTAELVDIQGLLAEDTVVHCQVHLRDMVQLVQMDTVLW